MKKFLCTLLFVAAAAQAAVVYEFTGTRTATTDPFTGSFTLTLAAPPAATTDYLPGAALTCDVCNHVEFVVDAVAAGFTVTPSVVVAYGLAGTGSTFFFYFAPGSFNTNGVHDSFILDGLHDGTLTVRGVTGVPEPSTMALALAGAALVAVKLRRR